MKVGRASWALMLVLAVASPLAAAEHRYTPELELFAGDHNPATDDKVRTLTPDPNGEKLRLPGLILGVRAGVRFERFGYSASVSHYQRSREIGDLRRTFLDLDVSRSFGRLRRARLVLHGGAGIAWTRATDAQESELREAHVPSVSFGVGGRFILGPRIFLSPDARWRWYASRDDDSDWQVTLGVGFVLGKRADQGARHVTE